MRIFFIALFLFATSQPALSLEKTANPSQPFRNLDHIAAFNFYRTQHKSHYCDWYWEYQSRGGTVSDGKREAGSIQEGYKACSLTELDANIQYMALYNLNPVKLSIPATVTAFRHAKDMCEKNYFGDVARDGSRERSRLRRMGNFVSGAIANENIWYTNNDSYSPLTWITKYHIDDGVKNRKHRRNLVAKITHAGIAVYKGKAKLRKFKDKEEKDYTFHVLNGVSRYTRGTACNADAVAQIQAEDAEEGQTGVPGRYGNIDDGIDAAGNVRSAPKKSEKKAETIAPYESNFQNFAGAKVICHSKIGLAHAGVALNKTAKPTGKSCVGNHDCDFKGYASSATQCNLDVFCCKGGNLLRAINVVPPMKSDEKTG